MGQFCEEVRVINPDLQVRYWQGMTNAWLNAMTASVASFGVMNSAVIDSMQTTTQPRQKQLNLPTANATSPLTPMIEAWSWPLRMINQSTATAKSQAPADPAQATLDFFANGPQKFADAMGDAFSFASPRAYGPFGFPSTFGWNPMAPWMPQPRADMSMMNRDLMRSMTIAFWNWPAIHWPLYTAPATAAMLSSGVPYPVALPAVRSGLAALDAADAMRLQIVAMFEASGITLNSIIGPAGSATRH